MSEIIVLDTHIWIWWTNGDVDQFPQSWCDRIRFAARVGVSPISCYEVDLAHQRGKLELPYPAKEWLQKALTLGDIELFPLTEIIAARAVELSPIHRDPFDRLIIATTLEIGQVLPALIALWLNILNLPTI